MPATIKRFEKACFGFIIACLFASCSVQKKAGGDNNLDTELQQVMIESSSQYKLLMKIRPENKLPRTFEKNKLLTTGSDGWVSGFYPGTLFYLYQFSHDSILLKEGLSVLNLLKKEQFNKGTHDLGFMMYCSFGNAAKVSQSSAYDTILINSAKSLSSRFNPAVGCIRSWNSDSSHFLVIIDNMMNLELLMYAFRQTNDSSFYKIAVTHANTTLKNHFRGDHSSYHVIDYNANNGVVQKKHTHQGAADESAWARGQAWGLYGYTMMYRETGDNKYLQQAIDIANFILNHPNLPKDKIPYWDFNAPGIPAAYRDVSAAAIISSALLELSEYVSLRDKKRYRNDAITILKNLSRPTYKTMGDEAGGFLLQHSVGHLPNKSEIDVPLSYADYYYVEAILRYLGKLEIKKKL